MAPEVAELLAQAKGLADDGWSKQALEPFLQAIDLSDGDLDARFAIAEQLRKSGWFAVMSQNLPEDAWVFFDRARILYGQDGARGATKLWEVERGLSVAMGKTGQQEEALRHCDRAERLTQAGDQLAKVWSNRAIALSYLGRERESEEYARKALGCATDPKTRHTARQSLGILLIKRGEPEEALAYLEEPVHRAWALVDAGRFDEVDLAPGDRPRAYLILARKHLGLGDPARAIETLRAGVGVVERGRAGLEDEMARAGFQAAHVALYGLLVDLLAREQRWEEAFDHAEAARARSFFDFVVNAEALRARLLRGSESKRLARLKDTIAELHARRDLGEDDLRRLEELEFDLRSTLRRLRAELVDGDHADARGSLPAARVRQRLRPGQMILEYHVSNEALHVFLVTRESLRGVRLSCRPEEVLANVRDLSRTLDLTWRGRRRGRSTPFEWHQELVGEALLAGVPLDGVEELIIVPHGPLHLVPFAALRIGGRYLVERCAVTIAPSASVHCILEAKGRSRGLLERLLFVHDPSNTLAHVDEEEEAVREAAGIETRSLSGTEADPARVLAEAADADIVHFACHGEYRASCPEHSYLEMAGGRRMEALDILRTELPRTRLVVLSACESGRADFARADEMIGLPRAFLRAGARGVVATHWPVEDHPAIAAMMRTFYRNFPTSTPAHACRAAQVEAIAQGVSPLIWASLAVYGV